MNIAGGGRQRAVIWGMLGKKIAAVLWRTVIQPGDMAGAGIVAKVLIADFR